MQESVQKPVNGEEVKITHMLTTRGADFTFPGSVHDCMQVNVFELFTKGWQ
jgi:hypothetical protein